MTDDKKIVWILGAGFSQPLGAPLLRDLMTEDAAERVKAVYGYDFSAVSRAYRIGREKPVQWEDAEQFLEALDYAGDFNSARFKILRQWADNHVPDHGITQELYPASRASALRFLAAECCLFLQGVDEDAARMAPYVDWAKSLKPTDTVLTFNYDRVVEVAAKGTGLVAPTPRNVAHLPARREGPVLLKMHGSVDWKFEHGRVARSDDPEAAVHCTSADGLAIATPGPTKQDMTSPEPGGSAVRGRVFSIWKAAAEAIACADAIVLIGYRIPPTDSATRQWLIDRIRDRMQTRATVAKDQKNAEKLLFPVHSVLGWDTTASDPLRVARTVSELDPMIWHHPWPMRSEEFLGLVTRDRLLQRPSVADLVADGDRRFSQPWRR